MRKRQTFPTHLTWQVKHKMQAENSVVELDDVPYGQNGSWAINIWMRVQSLDGSLFEYVYSHNSTAPDPSGWAPNQVTRPAGSLTAEDAAS